jgi:hypothetical protein
MSAGILFDIEQSGSLLRWKNYEKFIESRSGLMSDSELETLAIFVTFNASESAIEVADYILSCGLPLIIIDNHSDEYHSAAIRDYITGKENAVVVRTSLNLGGAGGYALGLEIFLESSFSDVLLTEDDAVPASDNLLNKILAQRGSAAIVGCQYINNRSASFSFHFTLYARDLISLTGVPDPRFFQGGDDADLLSRHQDVMSKMRWVRSDVDLGYFHPTLKGSGTPAKVIRSQRNLILSELRRGRRLHAFLRSYLLMAYSIYSCLIGRRHAGWRGIYSFADAPRMRFSGDLFSGSAELHKSIDASCIFSPKPVDALAGWAATPHLRSLLDGGRSLNRQPMILTTMDSPWYVPLSIFFRKCVLVKNLSRDGKNADVASADISINLRLKAVASCALAGFLSVPFFILYFIFSRKISTFNFPA